MRAIEYCFSTIWRFDAPMPTVWDAIHDSAQWPQWWKNVEQVENLVPGNGDGVGAVQRYTWKGALPYRLIFDVHVTDVEPLQLLAGDATGDVAGRGCWRFSAEGGTTVVRYDWQVRTTRTWMNLLAPLARPFFQWNHDAVMREGGAALARRIGVTLLDDTHTE
ncbi:SRPBCC family protein [Paraburkholderia flava]|uniref:SRPBCC family protein n=1 Tax=Paraburkholderia flava TaxID=2547393 RepID=UPI00105E7A39|nr:SRPBCC family protein [Paraburkholderia flava]